MNDSKDTELQKWLNLDEKSRLQIVNHTWNPYNPEIGFTLKTQIVEYFGDTFSEKVLQYGIKSFGWDVYMLFVIVEDSKIRIPQKFANLMVNKGVIKEKLEGNKYNVKFNYGGIRIVEIENKINIK